MIVPDRIGHVVIKVRDLERSKKFYTEVLGLTQMMEIPEIKMAFFASNARDHHELACVEVGADAPGPRKGEIGLVHIAFRLRDEDHLRAAHAELKRLGVPIISTVDHGVSLSIYFRDPDGHQLEVYCDGTPEHRARFANDYMGSGKLEFAKDEPGIGALVKGLTS
ncbi:VOC family protein [bacterium]|jgi:catechol 2,3-dioxygenase|nr:VOC family protein [bacterium]